MSPSPTVLELCLYLVIHMDARDALMHLDPESIRIHQVIPNPSL